MIQLVILSVFLFIFPLFSSEKTGIDYDTSQGNKPVLHLRNYKSKLVFRPDANDIKDYYSDFEVEEQKSNGMIMILRLTENSKLKFEFNDFDLTGKFETYREYKNGFVSAESKIDEKLGITTEKTLFAPDGSIIEILTDLKKQGYLSEKNIYQNGKIIVTEKDKNGDGLFEEIIFYSKKRLKKNKSKIEYNRVDSTKDIFMGGFYSHGDIITLNKALTNKVIRKFKDRLKNTEHDVAAYQKLIFAEKKGDKLVVRNYPNRFSLYQAIAKIKNQKMPKAYVLAGDVFTTRNRVSIYYRILGPSPIQTVYSGSIHMAASDFTNELVADKMVKAITEKIK